MTVIVLKSLVLSLGMTLLTEISGALVLGIRRGKDLLLVFLVNVLTNLPLVLILDLVYLFDREYLTWYLVALLEIAAVITEGILYQNYLSFRKWHPALVSLVLNAISYFGGLIL